ncbi:uncharacterized protein LOC124268957 [Haliotis rubra]|uniref:uncharacterized protein LOC124268957 n=1 Tax=Haliotis rubra TaxID=36100 RepID=UPI001EE58B32|nr:uncharacterized protein LOC124268957 [Haliotis rubra]
MTVLTANKVSCKEKMSDGASGVFLSSNTKVCEVEHLPQQRGAGHTRKAKLLKGVLVVSLAINIILAALYAWRTVHRDTEVGPSAEALASVLSDEGTVCTDCRSLGVNPETYKSDLHGFYLRHVTGLSALCCLRNAEGLWRIASMFTNRFYKHTQTGTVPSEASKTTQSTGAHLYVDSEALKSGTPSLQWTQEYGYGSAYKSIDISTDGQSLSVTKPGLYHIYSFLTLKTHQLRRRPENFLHTMRRVNAHLPNVSPLLLMAKKTLPEVSERFVTSYLSATVRLRQDDHVSVTASNMSHVYRYPPSNFFGLYYVGE